MELTEQIKGKVSYDGHNYIFDENMKMILEIRGWGWIQYLFKDSKDAVKFQDEMGKFIAEAINEKLERERK